jgi:hypothetical protein
MYIFIYMAQMCNPTYLIILLLLLDLYLILCRMCIQVQMLYTNVVGNNVQASHPHGVRNCCLQIVFLTDCVVDLWSIYLPDFTLLAPVDYLVAIKRKDNEKIGRILFYSFTFHTHINFSKYSYFVNSFFYKCLFQNLKVNCNSVFLVTYVCLCYILFGILINLKPLDLNVLLWRNIQGVPGGMCQTSGVFSLC